MRRARFAARMPTWVSEGEEAQMRIQRAPRLDTSSFTGGEQDMNDKLKCPRCGTLPFQHWLLGYMHKCHVCGTIWRSETNEL